MSKRPTPETDTLILCKDGYGVTDYEWRQHSRRLERERDEAREALREWQTLRLWGAEPQHIHDFIKGQQARIHESQDIEKTCEQLERERDEAREDLEFRRGLYKVLEEASNRLRTANEEAVELARTLKQERDEAREALDEETKFHHRTHSELVQTQCKLMDAMQAIIDTLEENRYLADGDDCTLAKLKSVVPDWK